VNIMVRTVYTLPAIAALLATSLCVAAPVNAILDVWPGPVHGLVPDSERAKQQEGTLQTKDRHDSPDTVVWNVTHPTLEVVLPTARSNGAAIIVAPGGGFNVLSYANEGTRVAQWLAAHGYTAFILKYRLKPLPNDPKVLQGLVNGGGPRPGAPPPGAPPPGAPPGPPAGAAPALPPITIGPFEKDAIADGAQALKLVRSKAADYGIDAARVGFIGFSAGGVVSGSSGTAAAPADRANFVGIIYSHVVDPVPKGAPPAFFAGAADDPLSNGMAADFAHWREAGSPAEIHIYSKGQHGFGTVKQGLPVDHWLDAFNAWVVQQGFTTSASK
jgi:acetyl esterase/lipase